MNICVLIPAYNEANTIAKIVDEIDCKGLDVIVVDDGSGDATGETAAKAGAVVLSHKTNLGKGASLRQGFDYIITNTKYDSVITMDGDGQHKVDDIENFIDKVKSENSDIIIGNRMRYTKNMPFVRLCTNMFMSWLLSKVCGQSIPDTQCGYRFFKKEVLEALDLISSNFDLESEILIKASRKGFNIASVPIETIYQGEKSDIHPVKDTIRFMKLVARELFFKR